MGCSKKKLQQTCCHLWFRGDVFPDEVRYVSAVTGRIHFVLQLLMPVPLETTRHEMGYCFGINSSFSAEQARTGGLKEI
ncbi:hypothetical protein TNCV_3025331 [Trichonephila clavipes]|nr:hypothetical protein TNCV_3025331 [Trichonephila clavipes]